MGNLMLKMIVYDHFIHQYNFFGISADQIGQILLAKPIKHYLKSPDKKKESKDW